MKTDPLDCVCFNTRKTARLLGQFYDDALEPSGLRNTQFAIVAIADRLGPISITELARALETERTTLTRNLQILERDALIEFGPGDDRRSKTVSLTRKGKSRLKQALPLWQSAQEAMLAGFGQRRWRALRKELSGIRTTLESS